MKIRLPKNAIDYVKPGMFVIFIVFIIIRVPIFFRVDNLISVVAQGAVIGIASIGMTMVILAGEIDISVGAMIYCSGAIASEVFLSTQSMVLTIFAAIVSGSIFGLLNGLGVAKFKIPSIITTLAVSNILTGMGSLIIGSDSTLIAGDAYKVISQTKILGLLSSAWLYIILFALFLVIVSKTRFGRYIYAIGDNADALRASGINLELMQTMIFVLTGTLCGIGGLLSTSRLGGSQFNLSLGTEIYCIAAVVVGGVSMTGGKGSLLGTLVGVFIVAALDNLLRLMSVSAYIYGVVWGIAIFTIVLIDILKKKQDIRNRQRQILDHK
ncbi:MAG: ABC transporter permease [Eubacteriales bacterium]|nr:ABC transporter permease [Eubacteriales bacterium]